MKKILILTTVIALFSISTAMINKPEKIIFFGDSITELGVQPNGYVDLIKKAKSNSQWEVIGAGISGNKVYDLFLRLEEDV
ncbi:MAG: G-D-S-L family lipolytic protein, partial [Sphingobacteriaceae bacterium]|nr:G-D-S-L family lipolytic protein [Sphingobacteriaceae bacterium]